jgi:threonine/homoserine/homoserine lactone efflux protein
MIPAANLIAFGLASIPLIIIPGPSVLFTIGRSLSLGRVGGLLTVVGNSIGAFVITVAIAFGLGAILEDSVVLFTIVKVLGAAYIAFLGVQAIRHRNQKADTATTVVSRRGPWLTLWEGFVVGVTNVKTIIFLVAVLPLFVDHSTGGIPGQIMLLGAVFVAVALTSDSIWALVAGSAREWFGRSPKRMAGLSATGGVMMIGLGASVLFLGHGKTA